MVFSSQFIASAPKYLTGVHHFLKDLHPEFNTNCSHALVKATIQESKKVWADPIHQKLPLCLAHLQLFINIADCTGSFNDLPMAMLLSCAFYSCHCIGELVQKNNHSLLDWRKIIK